MATVNRIILVGHLGRDPEKRHTQSGDAIANFSMATSEKWKDGNGTPQERVEWHKVEVFGKSADFVCSYCVKGSLVYVEGSIRYEEWVDKDGAKRNSTKVRVAGPNSRIMLMSGGRQREDAQAQPAAQTTDDEDGVPF